MDIEALRSFMAFVETGSFTRAAKQTHKIQSAVSMQMKKLEQELHKPLFDKHGRHLVLSVDGQRLALYAKQVLQLHDETVSALKSAAIETEFHLGCPDDYANSVLPRLVRLLRQSIANVNLHITCASSQKLRLMLDSGQLDAAIVTRLPESDEGYLLHLDAGVWVAAPGSQLPDQDLLPLVLFQKDCKFRAAAIDGLMKQGRRFEIVASSASASVLQGLVSQDMAVTAMARSSVIAPLTVIDSASLPALPVVALALVISSRPHSPLNADMAKHIAALYQENMA